MEWKETTKTKYKYLVVVQKCSSKCCIASLHILCSHRTEIRAISAKKMLTIQTESVTKGRRFWSLQPFYQIWVDINSKKVVKPLNTADIIRQRKRLTGLIVHYATRVTVIMSSVLKPTWSSLTGDGKLLQRGNRSCRTVEPGLMNPPVWSLPTQNPAEERPRISKCKHSLSFSLTFARELVTIWGPGWASLPGPPPRWAWPPCPSAGGTRPGRSRRTWCADQPRWTPGWTGPHTCCTRPAGAPPARPPSCGAGPWFHSLRWMMHWIWDV